jgi:hypothetical protein
MKNTHPTKASGSKVETDVKFSGATFTTATVSKDSAFGRILDTKKYIKAYAKGEITLDQLESMGIELG